MPVFSGETASVGRFAITRPISIRHTVDRFTIGRCRALVLENWGCSFRGYRMCGLTAKHDTRESYTPCQFLMDESRSDTYGYSECSRKPSYILSCDMPGQIRYMNWLILITPLSTCMLNCAINLGRAGPRSCFTTTGLLSVKLCHQFGKRRAGDLFYNNRSAQW